MTQIQINIQETITQRIYFYIPLIIIRVQKGTEIILNQ